MSSKKAKQENKIRVQNVPNQVRDSRRKFEPYVSQIINVVSATAQATRPPTVGQMSQLVPKSGAKDVAEWSAWYQREKPGAVDNATEKAWTKLQQYRDACAKIDKETVRRWMEDIIFVKTFYGIKVQWPILEKLSTVFGLPPKLSEAPEEEAKGIDGYLGSVAVSIKPESYRREVLPETIDVPIVFYEKDGDELVVEYSLLAKALGK